MGLSAKDIAAIVGSPLTSVRTLAGRLGDVRQYNLFRLPWIMANAIEVSDHLSNVNEQIEAVANAIGRSKVRRQVFEAIYHHKSPIKTVGRYPRTDGPLGHEDLAGRTASFAEGCREAAQEK